MDELLAEIRNAATVIATPSFVSILSAIAAIVTVIIAIIVAYSQNKILKKQTEISKYQAIIAEQQNKIALFEARFTAYKEVLKLGTVLDMAEKFRDLSIKTLLINLILIMDYREVDITDDSLFFENLEPYSLKTTMILQQIPYIFHGVEDEDARSLSNTFFSFFMNLAYDVENVPTMKVGEQGSQKKHDFSLSYVYFRKKYDKMMKNFLCIV